MHHAFLCLQVLTHFDTMDICNCQKYKNRLFNQNTVPIIQVLDLNNLNFV